MFHHQIAPPRLTRILIAAAAVLIIASHVTTGLSGDEKPKTPAEKIETFPLEISVSDQDGVGIPGVTIRPYALRASAEAGTHYFWQPDKHGSTENHKTDADGKLILNCPKYVIEKLEIGQISVAITHPDYISLTSHLGVKKPAKLTMQRGRKYFVTAIDSETGEPYKTNLGAQLSGDGNGVEWKLDDTGTLSSVAVSPSVRCCRCFMFEMTDGRSTVIPLKPAHCLQMILNVICLTCCCTQAERSPEESTTECRVQLRKATLDCSQRILSTTRAERSTGVTGRRSTKMARFAFHRCLATRP